MEKDSELAEAYCKFMEDYLKLGHMRQLSQEEINDKSYEIHYIQHHGIWQKSNKGKKLRVIFNASKPTTAGHGLNDVLHSGPKLQIDIASVITRWRTYRIAFCADIKMMFRQIKTKPQFLAIKHFVLSTATYGIAPAPYLSLRVLKQLCLDKEKIFLKLFRLLKMKNTSTTYYLELMTYQALKENDINLLV